MRIPQPDEMNARPLFGGGCVGIEASMLSLVHSNSTRQVEELLFTSHSFFQAK